MKKIDPKLLLIFIILAILLLAYHFGLSQYLTLDYLKENQAKLLASYNENSFLFITLYFFLYILVSALSIPGGATLLSIAGGAIFGFLTALVLVSFASTIGGTLAFLSARFLFRDFIQKKFEKKLNTVNKGFEKDGVFYLLSLRLVPAFPNFLINLLMGLTTIKVKTYYFTSQVGMLIGTAIYVNAGVQLSKITTVDEILSPSLIISLFLVGLLPLLGKFLYQLIKR